MCVTHQDFGWRHHDCILHFLFPAALGAFGKEPRGHSSPSIDINHWPSAWISSESLRAQPCRRHQHWKHSVGGRLVVPAIQCCRDCGFFSRLVLVLIDPASCCFARRPSRGSSQVIDTSTACAPNCVRWLLGAIGWRGLFAT